MRNVAIATAVLSMLATVSLCLVRNSQAQLGQENTKPFMRAKLAHSQEVLKGLTTEDFTIIVKNAQEMSLLSQAAQWQVIQTPEYVQRSAEFRREVDGLMEAAREKNLDGATLAYVKVTMNCIECHKYVRSVRSVRLDDHSLRR